MFCFVNRLAVVLVCLVSFGVGGAEVKKPNFVIIFIDDMGYGDLSCYGNEVIRTPRIDGMAKEGMKFTSFYAQMICGPSRTALMTGCYPMRVAEVGNLKNTHPVVHTKEVTLAEVLKEVGYATGCFGKWDMATHNQLKFLPELMPNFQGYDYFYGTPTSNDGFVNLYRNAELIEEKTDMNTLTRRYTDEALGFIRRHKGEPFLVYLPHTMPHTKLGASDDFRGKSARGLYGDVIEEIDFNTGRILDLLEEEGLAENTYVLLTSDNGPWLIKNKGKVDGHLVEDHGGSAGVLRSGKVSTWEGGCRVPAVFWAPGRIEGGSVCDDVAATIDVLPTFAELAGGEVPSDRVIDGRSIVGLLEGKKGNAEKVFYYYAHTHLQAVRQGRWKLHVARPGRQPWIKFSPNNHINAVDDIGMAKAMLFDLDSDIGEMNDVANEYPEVVSRLEKLLEKGRNDIGDYDRIGTGQRFFDGGEKRPDSKKWIPGVKVKVKVKVKGTS